MMRTHAPFRRRSAGFASMLAIAMLGLSGVVVAGMLVHFATEARRTRTAAIDAQLRQVLQAGALVIDPSTAPREGAVSHGLALPKPLTSRGGVVQAVVVESATNQCRIRLTARLDGREARQTLRYQRTTPPAPWQLAEAVWGQ